MANSQQTAINQMMDSADAMLQSNQEDYVTALMERYSEFEARLSADILKIHTQIFAGGEADYASFLQFQGDVQVAQAIQSELTRLNQDVNESLLDELVSQYKDAYNASSWVLDSSTPSNIDPVYQMPLENAIKQLVSDPWQGAMFSQRIGVINDFMAQDIQQAVVQAMISGDSTNDLADRISGIIGNEDSDFAFRAKRISQTELLRAMNMARHQVWTDNSKLMEGNPIWVTRALASGRLCLLCAARAGKTLDEIEIMVEEDDPPGQADLELDAPAHPFCACTTMPNVKSWEELMAPGYSGEGVTGEGAVQEDNPMTFADWSDTYLTNDERGNN